MQAFQYLGFTADLQSTTLIRKAKEKTPHLLVLKWTEHCLTELSSDPTLVDFQQWLELQAQNYYNVSRESNQRTISSQASKFVNSNNLQIKPYNSNLSVSANNASAGNSRKHLNFAHQQKQPSFSQNVRNKICNTNRAFSTTAFSTEVFSGNNPTASSSSKDSGQTPNTSSQQKSQTNKAPSSLYGQIFNNRSQQNLQRSKLNSNVINQSLNYVIPATPCCGKHQ